jgi:hypothetical protein
MTIEEKIREIMRCEKLSDSEKLGSVARSHPAETFNIDSLSTATPEQVRQLGDGLAVTHAMQQIRRIGLRAHDG